MRNPDGEALGPPDGSLLDCVSGVVGVTGRDRLAILPVSSAAGLILPDGEVRESQGNPVIDSLLVVPVCTGLSSSFAFGPQRISMVGVVAPNARAEVTIGGDDVPGERCGRCGHESEGERRGKEPRVLFRASDDDDCVFSKRRSFVEEIGRAHV